MYYTYIIYLFNKRNTCKERTTAADTRPSAECGGDARFASVRSRWFLINR